MRLAPLRWGMCVFFLLTAAIQSPLIIGFDSQGIWREGEVTLTVGYGTVSQNTRLTITPTENGLHLDFNPQVESTALPILLRYEEQYYLADAPGEITPIPAGQYLIYFDTVQVFAQHETEPNAVFSLGTLESYRTDFPVARTRAEWQVETVIESDGEHVLEVTNPSGEKRRFLAASQLPRYRARIAGQNLGHPTTFQFLGWSSDLPTLVQLMLPPLPLDLPSLGREEYPLWLPFDCEQAWLVSWGFHFSTPQNRYAVDFASAEGVGTTAGLPLRAAMDGQLFLKKYGYDDEYIDLGLAARIVAEDGVTSVVYGHLDERSLDLWDMPQLSPFEWVAVGEIRAGEIIGFAGLTGYVTGAHIHIVIWTYDQSLVRPVFDGLAEFERGQPVSHLNCEKYP